MKCMWLFLINNNLYRFDKIFLNFLIIHTSHLILLLIQMLVGTQINSGYERTTFNRQVNFYKYKIIKFHD